MGHTGSAFAYDLRNQFSIPTSEDNYYILNISDKRDSTVVFAYGNDLNGYESDFYGVAPQKVTRKWIPNSLSEYGGAAAVGYNGKNELVKLEENTNLLTSNLYWFTRNDDVVRTGDYGHNKVDKIQAFDPLKVNYYYTTPAGYQYSWSQHGLIGPDTDDTKRTLYSLKEWKNYFLQSYKLPFPKGYIINGQKLK